jgi:A/G-specific adenine glycosylase
MWPHLLAWYNQNKRALPWRDTQNPYHIWLSEVILQQTRVEQGLPYYQIFLNHFPDIQKMAQAPETEIMKLWQGLGYYSRAINMHHTAKLITTIHNGVFPRTYDELITLKGIGPYTAAAIASFAFGQAKAVVDGNVFRVLSRLFMINTPINSAVGKKEFSNLANQVLHQQMPAIHNQAMMELGATVCKPSNPNCNDCPLQLNCLAYQHNTQSHYPVKLAKNKPIDRYLHYLFIVENAHTYIIKRDKKGIWKSLYEPPNVETNDESEALASFASITGTSSANISKYFETKHQLTHQTIYATFWVAHTNRIKKDKHWEKHSISTLHKVAVHRLFDKFLNYYNLRK